MAMALKILRTVGNGGKNFEVRSMTVLKIFNAVADSALKNNFLNQTILYFISWLIMKSCRGQDLKIYYRCCQQSFKKLFLNPNKIIVPLTL